MDAGIVWDSLSNYPGYQKYIWRERARAVLTAAGAQVAPQREDDEVTTVPRFLE